MKLFEDQNYKKFAEQEKAQISVLKQKESYHLNKAKEIEDKLEIIQKSTKVNIPQLSYLHNYLRAKFAWYSSWHLQKNSSTVNSTSASVISLIIAVVSAHIIFSQSLPARAELTSNGENFFFNGRNNPEFVLNSKGLITSNERNSAKGRLFLKDGWISAYLDEDNINSPSKITISNDGEKPDIFYVSVDQGNNYKPGKHKLSLLIENNGQNQLIEKDFIWGGVIVNYDKPYYQLGQEVNLYINVTNDSGELFCGAEVSAEITDPDGVKTMLSQKQGDIKSNVSACSRGISDLGMYSARLKTSKSGSYKVAILTKTPFGERKDISSFVVREMDEVSIIRKTPNVVETSREYSTELNIISNINYSGPIREYLPDDFIVSEQEGMDISLEGEQKVLTWDYSLNKGDSMILSYKFKIPDLAPMNYMVGPLQIGPLNDQNGEISSSNHIYKEPYCWEVVSELNDSLKNAKSLSEKDKSGTLRAGEGEVEIASDRTESFKVFDLGNNTYRVGGTIGDIHYKDNLLNDDEIYKEINLSIKINNNKKANDYDYYVDENGYKIKIWNSLRNNGKDINYVARFLRGGQNISMAPVLLAWQNEAGEIQEISRPVQGIIPFIDNDNYTITWQNAFGEGIDFRYNISSDKFFKTVIINDLSSLPNPAIGKEGLNLVIIMSTSWSNVKTSIGFSDDIDYHGLSNLYDYQKDKTESINEPQEYTFKDKDQKNLWWVQKPIAWDSSLQKNIYQMNWSLEEISDASYMKLGIRYEDIITGNVIYPIYLDASISEESVVGSSDDAYSPASSTDWTLTSATQYLNNSADTQYNGLRWTSVPIPQGADVTTATICMDWYDESSDDPNVTIYGNDVDSADTFSSSSDNYSTRDKTTASVIWNADSVADWGDSSDISAVIDEIVSRAGWSSGNNLALLTVKADTNVANYYTYDQGAGYGAKFNAEYTEMISVAGTCKKYDQSADCADSQTIKVAVNGVLQDETASTSSGAWTINSVEKPSTNDVITVFIDNVDDELESVAVAKYDGSGNISGINLFERHLSTGSDDNQTITNADISQYDNSASSDEDIFIEVDANNDLTIPASSTSSYSDQEIIIKASNTFRPDSTSSGNVSTPNIEIVSSAVLTADGNTISITDDGTPFVKTGTFNYNTSTFKYLAEGDTNVVACDYYNLEIKPTAEQGGGWKVATADDSSYNGVYMPAGTVNGETYYTYQSSSGLRYLYSATNPIGSDVWRLNTATHDDEYPPTSDAYYSDFMEALPANDWSAGTATPPAPVLSAGTLPYTFTFGSGTINVINNFTNGDGTNGAESNADTNDTIVNIDGNFSNAAKSIYIASNSAAFSVAKDFTNNSSAFYTHSDGTLTLDGQSTQSITYGGSEYYNIIISNTSAEVSQADASNISATLTLNSNSQYDINGQNISLTTLSNSGTFRLQGGETTVTITNKDTDSGTVEYDGSGTYSSLLYGDGYNNLLFSGTGTYTIASSCVVAGDTTINGSSVNLGNNTVTLSTSGVFNLDSGAFTIANQGSGRTKNTANGYDQSGGTYTVGQYAYSDINGNYSVSGGTFTHSSYGRLYISGDYSFASATFTKGTYMYTYFDGDSNSAINSAPDYFQGTTYLNKGAAYTLTLNDDVSLYSFTRTSGEINSNDQTITVLGSASSFKMYDKSIDNIVIDNTIYIETPLTVTDSFTVNSSDTAIVTGSGTVVTLTDTARLTLNGTIQTYYTSNGYYVFQDDAATNFPLTGTVDGVVKFETLSKNISIPARTYKCRVEVVNNSSLDYSATLATDASQSITIGGSTLNNSYDSGLMIAANGDGDITLDANTYDPNLTITNVNNTKTTADIDFIGSGSGTEIINAGSGSWDTKGDIVFTDGTFNHNSGSITLSGTGSQAQSITSASQSLNNLTITNASSGGVTFADSATVSGTFTAITASSVITFNAGSTYAFANININGQASETKITLKSSTPDTQWFFNVSQASPEASYVTVSDSDANGGNAITPIASTDGGNNENWLFGITISGTVYTAEDKLTNIGADKTIALSINGGSAETVETTSGGAFEFSGVSISADQTVTIFIDDESEEGDLISQALDGSTNISGLEMYTNKVVLRHEAVGPMTNTLLATADDCSDSDIKYTISSGNADFSDDFELWIDSGMGYTPGGTLEVDDIDINGSLTSSENAVTVHGSWDANGGSVTTSGTVTFDGSSGTISIGSGGESFNNLVLNDGGGSATFRITTALDVNGTFTLSDGELDFDNNDPTVNIAGNITIDGGSVTKSSSDALVTLDGDLTYDDNVGVNFGDIIIGASPDSTNLSSDFICDSLNIATGDYLYTNGYEVDSAGDITIASGAYLDATDDGELDSTIINIAGSWSNSGTFTADSSNVIFDATATGKTLSGTMTGSSAFNLLEFNGNGGEWTLQNDITTDQITLSVGSLIDNGKVVTVNGDISVADVVGLLTSTGSWIQNASGDISNPNSTTENGVFNSFYSLTIKSGITSTKTAIVWVRKIILESSATLNGSYYLGIVKPYGNDFIDISSAGDIIGTIRVYPEHSTSYTQKSIDITASLIFNYANNSDVTLTGNWSTDGDLVIFGYQDSNTESEALTIDCDTFNLNIAGDLLLGHVYLSEQRYFGKILFGSGSHLIGGDIAVVTGDGDTYGYFDFESSDVTVSGNVDFSYSTVTSGTSSITANGDSAQSITSASQSLNNLTITNASSGGVTFADSATVSGTFTAITASSVITFNAGSTYAFANININGQASETKITLKSSTPDTQWFFNVSQTSPEASYVTVSDSDANGGNAITPISSTDGGNNENWLFAIISSISLTNPYGASGNSAIADNTTEWNYQITIENGAEDLNYTIMRLANNSDYVTPYDSLTFKWVQSTDTFSEESDTQDCSTLISDSGDSNYSEGVWTLDLKIKFDSDFSNFDTGYSVEAYVLDQGDSDTYKNFDNVYQVNELALSISVDSSTLDFSNLMPGSVVTKTTTITVTCNYANGYTLAVSDLVSGVYSALLHTDLVTRIADYSATIDLPTLWDGTGLGITVYSATNKDADKWGSGTTENDLNNKYAGVPETATIIHSKTGSPTSNDQTKVGYKAQVPNTQKTGNYSGAITYTATGALD